MNMQGSRAFIIRISMRMQREDIIHPNFNFIKPEVSELYSAMNAMCETEFSHYANKDSKFGVSVSKFEENEDGLVDFVGFISAFGFEVDNKRLEESYKMCVMNHICEFDFRGYRIFSDYSEMSVYNQAGLSFDEMRESIISGQAVHSMAIGVEDLNKSIEYIVFRDSELEIMNDMLSEDYGDYEDDNTFRPRTNDEILGDLGSDDDDDDY